MNIQIFLLIGGIPGVLSIVALLILLIRFKSRPYYLKLLGILLIIYAVLPLIILSVLPREYRNYAGTLSTFIEFCLLSLVYFQINGKKFKALYVVLFLVFAVFTIANVLFIQKSDINSYSLVLTSLIILAYAVMYFYLLLVKMPAVQLHTYSQFWFNAGSIIYYGGSFFLFVFADWWNSQGYSMLWYWTIHNFLMIIQILTIIATVWMDKRTNDIHLDRRTD